MQSAVCVCVCLSLCACVRACMCVCVCVCACVKGVCRLTCRSIGLDISRTCAKLEKLAECECEGDVVLARLLALCASFVLCVCVCACICVLIKSCLCVYSVSGQGKEFVWGPCVSDSGAHRCCEARPSQAQCRYCVPSRGVCACVRVCVHASKLVCVSLFPLGVMHHCCTVHCQSC